ncbi:hypothetical protein ANAEL_01801 [Anaerolineales bacterium]|nr:hypothetical protein ANAEL_01801 [Anaerolineales bacterium]
MFVPAIALGLLVVFGIGCALTFGVVSKIESKLEQKKRKLGLIPSVDQTSLDVTTISIAGGTVAVVLVLILLFAVPRGSGVFIWYILIGIGILLGIFSWFPFDSGNSPTETKSTQTTTAPSLSAPVQSKQTSREQLYQHLLTLTKHDKDLAERLIEYERKRKPNASEEELIKNAIERWELDNR